MHSFQKEFESLKQEIEHLEESTESSFNGTNDHSNNSNNSTSRSPSNPSDNGGDDRAFEVRWNKSKHKQASYKHLNHLKLSDDYVLVGIPDQLIISHPSPSMLREHSEDETEKSHLDHTFHSHDDDSLFAAALSHSNPTDLSIGNFETDPNAIAKLLDDDEESFLNHHHFSFDTEADHSDYQNDVVAVPTPNLRHKHMMTPGTFFRERSGSMGTISGKAPTNFRPNFSFDSHSIQTPLSKAAPVLFSKEVPVPLTPHRMSTLPTEQPTTINAPITNFSQTTPVQHPILPPVTGVTPLAFTPLKSDPEIILEWSHEVLDFGMVSYSQRCSKYLQVTNHSAKCTTLSIAITASQMAAKVSWLISAIQGDSNPKHEISSDGNQATMQLLAGQRAVVWLQFQAVGYQVAQGMKTYCAQLLCQSGQEALYASPHRRIITLLASVGYARLQTPRNTDSLLTFMAHKTSCELPLRNSGCIPIQLSITCTLPAVIHPPALVIDPSQTATVKVSLEKGNLPSDGFLVLQSPSASYRLPMKAMLVSQAKDDEPAEEVSQILFKQPVIYFPCVRPSERFARRFMMKNNGNDPLDVSFSIQNQHNCFKIDGPTEMKVGGGEEYSVQVQFQPSHLATFSTSLLVNCPFANQKLTIPLIGFGGKSRIELVSPSTQLVDMGVVQCGGQPVQVTCKLRNTGDIAGFVRPISDDNRVTVTPASLVIAPGSEGGLTIVFNPVVGGEASSMSPHIVIKLFTGDEILRRKVKRVRDLGTDAKFLALFRDKFTGEESAKEAEATQSVEDSCLVDLFQSTIECIPLTLFGSLILPTTETTTQRYLDNTIPSNHSYASNSSGSWSSLSTFSGTNFDNNNIQKKRNQNEHIKPSITPKSLLLFGHDLSSAAQLLIVNPTAQPCQFQAQFPNHSHVTCSPAEGIIPSFDEAVITVTLNSRKTLPDVPTWAENFTLLINGTKEVIHVCIQGKHENVKQQQVPLVLETTNILFPVTPIHQVATRVLRVYNNTGKMQQWSVASTTPSYLRFNEDISASISECDAQAKSVFQLRDSSGWIPPHSEQELLIEFQPYTQGVFTQYFALLVHDQGTQSSVQFTLRGSGTPYPIHKSPNEVLLTTSRGTDMTDRPETSHSLEKQTQTPTQRHPPMLYCKDSSCLFPPTFVGYITTQKLCICNGTSRDLLVSISGVDLPFIIKHQTMQIQKHSYVLVPCKFVPTERGFFQKQIRISSDDGTFKTTAVLLAEAVSQSAIT